MELKVKSLLEDKGKIRCVLSYRKRSIASVNRCLDEPYCSAMQPKKAFYRGVPCIFQTLHTGKTILVIPHYQRKWMLVAGCSCWLLNVVHKGGIMGQLGQGPENWWVFWDQAKQHWTVSGTSGAVIDWQEIERLRSMKEDTIEKPFT